MFFTITIFATTKMMINVGKVANGRCNSAYKMFLLMLALNLNLIGNYFMQLMICKYESLHDLSRSYLTHPMLSLLSFKEQVYFHPKLCHVGIIHFIHLILYIILY